MHTDFTHSFLLSKKKPASVFRLVFQGVLFIVFLLLMFDSCWTSIFRFIYSRGAGEDEWRQRHAPRQLFHLLCQLQSFKLCDFCEFQGFSGRDNGDAFSNFQSFLQFLCSVGAEEVVDGSLSFAQVCIDHAQSSHVENDGNGEGDEAHDDIVKPQSTVCVAHSQSHCVVRDAL